ncbi:helix-turn-helix domain-containing protein, partial [Barnesiella intestinihominis]|uniref:helix-turn-helix domain-containing protein n=3 Tax=Barnesiellaceae TaxID=2005519 RepID=UPI003AAE734E
SIPHVVLFAFVNRIIYKTNLCFLFILVTFVNYNFIITNLFTPLKMEENEALIVAERMKSFIEYKGISVTQFADATKIQRSSMSQILGGRNQKISINTIGKIHSAYPDLSIYWLLYGTGPMILTAAIPPAENITSPSKEFSTSLFPEENEIKPDEYTAPSKYSRENDSNIHQKQDHKLENEEVTDLKAPFFEPSEQVVKNKKVTKIMIFYSDNTFETFSPDNE